MNGRPRIGILFLTVALASAFAIGAGASDESDGKAWLGVLLGDAIDGGAEIVAVLPASPASRAGLLTGDVIVEAARQPTPGQTRLGQLIERQRPGDVLELVVLRGGEAIEMRVELGRRGGLAPSPPAPPATMAPAVAPPAPVAVEALANLGGVQVIELTRALREHYGAPSEAGVLVTRCNPEDWAGRAGIRVGDVLVRIGERPIDSPAALRSQLLRWKAGRPLEALLVRGGKPQELTVDLASANLVGARTVRAAESREDLEALERRLRLELERVEQRAEELRRALEALREKR